jgi:hypothetical protein
LRQAVSLENRFQTRKQQRYAEVVLLLLGNLVTLRIVRGKSMVIVNPVEIKQPISNRFIVAAAVAKLDAVIVGVRANEVVWFLSA